MDARKRAWIWAGLALTAGVGVVLVATRSDASDNALPSGSGAPALAAGERMFLVGDSLAVGLSAPMRQLCTASGVGFDAAAKQGTTVLAWASFDFPPAETTLISLGTNDMKMFDPLSERPKIDAMLARAKASSRRVVWLLPPPMPFPDRGVIDMITEAATSAGVELLQAPDVQRGPDKIHPTAAGYAAWAGLIWQYLQNG